MIEDGTDDRRPDTEIEEMLERLRARHAEAIQGIQQLIAAAAELPVMQRQSDELHEELRVLELRRDRLLVQINALLWTLGRRAIID
jgi:hypothetical protein